MLTADERRYRSSGVWSADREFWADRLAESPPPEGALTVRPNGFHESGTVRRQIVLDAARLIPVGRRGGGGTEAVLIAATAAFAFRRTGSRDIVIGHRSGERITPIRLAVAPGDTLTALTGRAGRALRTARRHHYLADFDDPWPDPAIRVWGAITGASASETARAPHGIAVTLDDSLATRWTVEALAPDVECAERFTRLLECLAEQPDRPIGGIDLESPDELRHLIEPTNSTARQLDPRETLLCAFERRAARTPDARAIVAGDHTLTYAEFSARVNRLARHLITAGVGPEMPVAVSITRSIDLVVALYAVVAAGGAYVPLDPDHPAARNALVLRAARPVCLLARSDRTPESGGVRVITVDTLDLTSYSAAPLSDSERRGAVRPDGLAYLIFTSGSTGAPKGVAVSHAAIVNQLEWMVARHELGPDEVYLQKTAVTFDVSLWGYFLPLRVGATLVLADPDGHRDPAHLADLIARHGVTVTDFVPSLLSVFTREAVAPGPNSLRQLFVIGEQLPPAVAAAAAGSSVAVHNLYGPTEVAVSATVHTARGESELVPIGLPAWNTRAYVLDPCLRPTPAGTVGELYLAGVQLARGYHGRAAASAERFVADPYGVSSARMYRTGDLVRRRPDGALEFVGRTDSQVKLRGQRIELGEIETALIAHPHIDRALVRMRRDGGSDDRLVAYLVLSGESRTATPEPAAWLSPRLPAYMMPGAFVVLDRLPLTSSGKLDVRALPAPSTDRPDYHAPSGPTEISIAAVFADVLGVARVGAHDSFFGLGGDSIMAILLVARARARGVSITPQDVFEYRTVAALAAVAVPVGPGDGGVHVLAELDGGGVGEMPLPPVLHHMIGRSEDIDRLTQSMTVRLPAGIDRATLISTLSAVVDRHDMLRARLSHDESAYRLTTVAPGSIDIVSLVHRVEIPANVTMGELRDIVLAQRSRADQEIDPANGVLLRCVWLDPTDAEATTGTGNAPDSGNATATDTAGWLLLVLHHLAIDGVSWRILLPDFISAWSQLSAGHPPQLPSPGTSMRRWTHALAEEAHRDQRVTELPLWRSIVDGPQPLLGERPFDPAVDRASTVRHLRAETPAVLADELFDVAAQRFRADPQEVLLTALALALAAWRGADTTRLLWLEHHGREEGVVPGAELSRTVGWFTAIFPARIGLGGIDVEQAMSGDPAAGDALKQVKEQLRALPDHGIGYGLLRYLNPETAPLLTTPAAEIGFRYLGRLADGHPNDAAWLPTADLPDALDTDDRPAAAALEISVVVAGNGMHTTFAHSRNLLNNNDIDTLAEHWQRALRALHAHASRPEAGGHTPSDLPLVRVTQAEIEHWEQRYGRLTDLWPLAPLQQGLHFHAMLAASSIDAYHVQTVLTLTGPVDRERLRNSVRGLLDRHASLRAAVVTRADGTAVQVVGSAVPLPWAEVHANGSAELAELLDADRSRHFRLDTPPLLRCTLITLGNNDFRLVVTTHHLLLDGWSMPIVATELLTLYATGANLSALPPVRNYRDYLARTGDRDTAAATRAWRTALGDGSEPALLAPENPGRRITALAARFVADLDERRTTLLRDCAAAHQVTVNTVLQCAWGITVALRTGRRDVVFGTTVSGRPADLLGVESMVGLFINTVPVRTRLLESETVTEFLTRQQREQSELVAHQHLGLADIHTAAGRSALFDNVLEFQSYPLDAAAIAAHHGPDDLAVTGIEVNDGTHYPLTVLARLGSRLTIRTGYLRDCFDEPTVQAIIDRWLRVLTVMVERPEARIGDLVSAAQDPVSPVPHGIGVRHPIDPDTTLAALIARQCARSPEATALEFEGTRTSYGEFAARVNRLARWLIAAGVGPESVVGVHLERGPELVVAIHAIVAAGGCYLPMDPQDPAARVERMIDIARPVGVIGRGESGLYWTTTDFAELSTLSAEPVTDADRRAPLRPDHPAYLIFTSGSTGEPKGVTVTHASVTNFLLWTLAEFGLGPDDVVLHKTPVTFDVSISELFCPLLIGATMVIAEPGGHLDPGYLARVIRSARITAVNFVPALLGAFLAHPDASECTSIARLFACGEELPAAMAQRVAAVLPAARVHNLYGPTEAAVQVAHHEFTAADARAVPIGIPLWNTRIYVLDSRLRPVPPGVAGEIHLAGPQLARGYAGLPHRTAERFVADPLHGAGERMYRTGDLGVWNSAGELEFLGRNDAQLQLRGRRTEPGEIEAALCEHPEVGQAVVLTRRAPGREEPWLVGYVVPDGRGGTPQSQRQLVDEWRQAYGRLYSGTPDATPALGTDFRGWTSSYTREPLPREEMTQWREATVERISRLAPRRILEIGAGSGLLLARLAPECETYWATDVSEEATTALRTALADAPDWAARVTVQTRPADDFGGLPEAGFDTVIVNSVAQYFPSAGYLSAVIDGALRTLAPGGALFIGDVRNLTLAPALATGIESAAGELAHETLADRVRRRLSAERELLLAPEYFTDVSNEHPEIGAIEIHVKRGGADNELTRYRYDVTLRKNPVGARSVRSAPVIEFTGLEALAAELRSGRPDVVRVSGIPHRGIAPELAAWERINATDLGDTSTSTSTDDRRRLYPEQCYQLAHELGLSVAVTLSSTPGSFDAIFTDPRFGPMTDLYLPAEGVRTANDPRTAALAGDLRRFLADRLPSSSVPTAIVVLDRIPTTASGKLDRRALPAPAPSRAEYESPRGHVEEAVAAAFAETLALPRVGRDDNFFDLGGHSLTATRLVGLLRTTLGVEVPIGEVFAAPTVTELAARAVSSRPARSRPVPMPRPERIPLSFAQRRVWFVHEFTGGAPMYNIPLALRLTGSLDLAALRSALNDVVARHEALRTTILTTDGIAYQHILSGEATHVDLEEITSEPAALGTLLAETARHRFDLAAEIPIRARMIHCGADEYVLALVIHHIAADGWSFVPLARDMAAAYASRHAGDTPRWDPLPVQYADYTLWQRQILGSDDDPSALLRTQLDYWRTELAGLHNPIQLLAQRPRPAQPTGAGDVVDIVIEADLLEAVDRYARAHRATTSMVLQAALAVLLHRLGAGTDIAIGGPVAGRTDTEFADLVGFFVNTWVLRVDLSGDPSFEKVLDRVRVKALAAYDNQDAPFERLVEVLAPPRTTAHHPLFQVLFAWQNNALPDLRFPGLQVASVPISSGTAKFDLFFNLGAPGEPGRGLPATGVVEYSTDLFDRRTVEDIVAQYLRLIARLLEAPGDRIATTPGTPDPRTSPTNAAPDRPPATIPELFDRQVTATPEAVALTAGSRSWTYRQLDDRSRALAAALSERGVGAETVVAVRLPRSSDLIVALLAVARAGGVYLPLDPDQPAQRTVATLHVAAPSVIITDTPLPDVAIPVVRPSDRATERISPASALHPDNAACLIFDPGAPKGVVISHRNLVDAVAHGWPERPVRRALLHSEIGSDTSLIPVWSALLTGGELVLAPPGRPDLGELSDLVARHRITSLHLPTEWFESAGDPDQSADGLAKLRYVVTSGDALSAATALRFRARFPRVRMINAYGRAENTLCAIMFRIRSGEVANGSVVPLGTPIGDVRAVVLNARLRPVPVGAPGGLYLAGAGVTRGYIGQPAATSARFVADPFGPPGSRMYRSGELVRWNARGELEFAEHTGIRPKILGDGAEVEAAPIRLDTPPPPPNAISDHTPLPRPAHDTTDSLPLDPHFPIRAGGNGIPVICVHPAGGISWAYAGLARGLDARHSIHALQAPGLRDHSYRPADVPAMAADYLTELRRIQLRGPYCLVGWSFGGLVAHAMATAIQDHGGEVARLILLDSYPADGTTASAPPTEVSGRRALLDFAGTPTDHIGDEDLDGTAFLTALRARPTALSALSDDRLERLAAVHTDNVRLAHAHRPARCRGDVTIVVAGRNAAGSPQDWRPHVTGEIHTHTLEIRHRDIAAPAVMAQIGRLIQLELNGPEGISR